MLQGIGRLRVSHKDADIIVKALVPDNTDWCRSYFENEQIIIEIHTENVSSMLNATEDFFLNIKAAIAALESLKNKFRNKYV